MPINGTLAVTGAAGRIGTALRAGLADIAPRLRLVDQSPVSPIGSHEEAVTADIRDLDAMRSAFDGVEVVVHLAAIPVEAPFSDIRDVNITGTYNVFEAARLAGCRRVVLASTFHVTGFYPWGERVTPSSPVRPDTYYAVSKVCGEALGRLYADKMGLEVVCLRIGGFADEPTGPGYLWIWLSPRDAVHLMRRSIEVDDVTFVCVYGVSRNTRRTVSSDGWQKLGYEPVDDAEAFADRFEAVDEPPDRWQGMEFARVMPGTDH